MDPTDPTLRRSKRNQAAAEAIAQASTSLSNPTEEDAPVPRKRQRRTPASTTQPATRGTAILKKRGGNSVKAQDPSERPSGAQLQQIDQPLSPFLALPRELRDEIYRHVLDQEEDATKSIYKSRNVVTRCGLVGVNSQIFEEFIDAVLFYASEIVMTVKNHNFAHVVTFLNRLSEAQLNQLRKLGPEASEKDGKARAKCQIVILLHYTARAKESTKHLHRWLDQFDVPEKRGKEIEFQYVGDRTYRCGGYQQMPKRMAMATASQRWKEEGKKIRKGAERAIRTHWNGIYR